MAFGKAIGAEALQLLESGGGKFGLIAVGDHAVDQLVAELARRRPCA